MAKLQEQEEWTKVVSSNIDAVRYDDATQKLYVKFLRGSTYSYDKVDLIVYTALVHADSVGQFLNQMIKPFHAYELVTV